MILRGVRPRLVAVWSLLLLLIAGIVVGERTGWFANRPPPDDGHGHGAAGQLLPVPIDEVGAVEIATAGVIHRFERDAAGQWFYHGVHSAEAASHKHQPDSAAAARIEQALAGFGRTRIERRLTLDVRPAPSFSAAGHSDAERALAIHPNVRDYGVKAPDTLILVYGRNANEPLARYAVGDRAPDRLSRYLHILGTQGVVTIADYHIDNLHKLVAEMSSRPEATPAGQ